MDKKKSSNWIISAEHYIISVWVPVSILNAIFPVFHRALDLSDINTLIIEIISYLALIAWSTKRSASYINKKYIVEDKMKIINASTIYYIFVILVNRIISTGGNLSLISLITSIIISTPQILGILLFYSLSKKHVQNDKINY